MTSPFTSGQTVNMHITVSGISRGPGIGGNSGNDRYNANGWNSGSLNTDDYFEFTLTPNSPYNIDFTSFVYTGQRSGTGPVSFAFRSSRDGFSTNIGAATATGATISLTSANYQNITSAITFRLYAWGASSSAGTFSVNDFTFNAITPLPVELTAFEVKTASGYAVLSFSTATESNNSHFVIERCADARTFSEIGQVRGAGTTQEPQQYVFTDENPLNGVNYYRLRQVDYDGTESLSPIVSVVFGKAGHIAIAPSPATDRVRIRLEEALNDDAQWQVFDNTGRQVLSGAWEAETSDYELDVNVLPEGTYTFRLVVGGLVQVKQFGKM